MPINETTFKGKLGLRDKKTKLRFEFVQKSSQMFKSFFEKGFLNFDAVYAILQYYHPEIERRSLWELWQFRQSDDKILNALENVLEKLKNE